MRCNLSFCCWVLAGVSLQANELGCLTNPLASRVTKFEAKGISRLQALLQLGYESQACLGIEALDQELRAASVELSLVNATVEEIIRKILTPASHLRVREQGKVVNIFRAGDTRTWLDVVMPNFAAPTAPRQALSNLLFMTFSLQNDPSIRTFAGSYPADQDNSIGPFKESQRSVREILGMLVSAGSAGAWIANSAAVQSKEVPKLPFWTILDYSTGREMLMSISAGINAESQR